MAPKYRRHMSPSEASSSNSSTGSERSFTLSGDNRNKRARAPRCQFHQEDGHLSVDCPYPTEVRYSKIRIHRGCYNCLKMGHTESQCQSLSRCQNCAYFGHKNRRHHVSLCTRPNVYVHRPHRVQHEDPSLPPALKDAIVTILEKPGLSSESRACRIQDLLSRDSHKRDR
jgi:hypothetical protein